MEIDKEYLAEMKKLNSDELKKQAKIYSDGIQGRTIQVTNYVNDEFKNKDLLYSCVVFINHIFLDGFKSYLDTLQRISFFPSNETQRALQDSINHLLIGSYRSAYDNLKRALEMMCVVVYFSDANIKISEVNSWWHSQSETPFFKRMVNYIFELPRYKIFDGRFQFKEKLKHLYYTEICDVTHVRGFEKSYDKLELSHVCLGGIYVPNISKSTMNKFLDVYIEVVQTICVILALYNPILLVDVPMEQKLGFNAPISGFFLGDQPKIFKQLMPTIYKDFFYRLALEDEEVISTMEWFKSQPDITDEELKRQVTEF